MVHKFAALRASESEAKPEVGGGVWHDSILLQKKEIKQNTKIAPKGLKKHKDNIKKQKTKLPWQCRWQAASEPGFTVVLFIYLFIYLFIFFFFFNKRIYSCHTPPPTLASRGISTT